MNMCFKIYQFCGFLLFSVTVSIAAPGFSSLAHMVGYGIGASYPELLRSAEGVKKVQSHDCEDVSCNEKAFVQRVFRYRGLSEAQEPVIKRGSTRGPFLYVFSEDDILFVPRGPSYLLPKGLRIGHFSCSLYDQSNPWSVEDISNVQFIHANLFDALAYKGIIEDNMEDDVKDMHMLQSAYKNIMACLDQHAAIIQHELGHYYYQRNYPLAVPLVRYGVLGVGAVIDAFFSRTSWTTPLEVLRATAVGAGVRFFVDWQIPRNREWLADEFVEDKKYIESLLAYFEQEILLAKSCFPPVVKVLFNKHPIGWRIFFTLWDPYYPTIIARKDRLQARLKSNMKK